MKEKEQSKKIQISLAGKTELAQEPNMALYQVRNGKLVKKLAVIEKNSIVPNRTWAKPGGTLALGPDVEEIKSLDAESLYITRTEDLISAERLEVDQRLWESWVPRRVCVSGSVQKCYPIWFDKLTGVYNLAPKRISGFASHETGCSGCATPTASLSSLTKVSSAKITGLNTSSWPTICKPVCYGIVEVYEICCKTILPPDLCDIFPYHQDCVPHPIDCKKHPWACDPCFVLPELCTGFPEIPHIDPIGPVVRPDISKIPLDPVVARSYREFQANHDPVIASEKKLPDRVISDLKAMMHMSAPEAGDYLLERPYLHPHFSICTQKKVGETVLRPDGSFTHCYRTFRKSCTVKYAFVVKQWQDGAMVEIYNGLVSHDYFTPDETKVLKANAKAQACQYEPGPDYEKPYVMLQKIGWTDTHNLASPIQTAHEGVNDALPQNGGLVKFGSASDCPWSKTLNFRLMISDDIYDVIKARYYRISIAPCDNMGNATDGFTPLIAPITWRKLKYIGNGQFEVEYVPLGPNPVISGKHGLYLIPDPSVDSWLDYFHGSWNSSSLPGWRYLVKVEIFDEHGNLLTPGSPGADFVYLHWSKPETFNPVVKDSLVHVLWTNHNKCFANIDNLRFNSLPPNSGDCQFITGEAGDTISLGYRAYHNHSFVDPTGGGFTGTFMNDYSLHWQRGFNGSLHYLDSGTTDRNPGVSPTKTLAEMFTGDSSHLPKKCTFMAKLYVNAKHTNGSSVIDEYDSVDYASFALEMVTE